MTAKLLLIQWMSLLVVTCCGHSVCPFCCQAGSLTGSINFGFAIFLPFMFSVAIAFLCFMHFIKSAMWLFHIL